MKVEGELGEYPKDYAFPTKETIITPLVMEKECTRDYLVLLEVDRNGELVLLDEMHISARNQFTYDDIIEHIVQQRYVHEDEEYIEVKIVKVLAERTFYNGRLLDEVRPLESTVRKEDE